MSNSNNYCGTGLNSSIAKPGDPNLTDGILTAQSGLGGISLYWSYPTINPEGLAHTQVYRSKGSSSFSQAILITTATGSNHFDILDASNEGSRFYYWIRMVSVNGTQGGLIGPASTVLQPSADQVREMLTGKVTKQLLDSGLLESIDSIILLSVALDAEKGQRLDSETVMGAFLTGVQENLESVDTVNASRYSELTTANSALVSQINFTLAKTESAASAILRIDEVRAEDNLAFAQTIEVLQAYSDTIDGKVETVKEVVDGQGAKWSVKLDVNGHVSGVAQLNDGEESSFIINADTFAVANTDASGTPVIPFLISKLNGESKVVFNAEALIDKGQINNLMIGQIIQSDDYSPATGKGWTINKSGFAEFNNVKVRGDIEATSIKANTIEAKHLKSKSIEAKHLIGGAVSTMDTVSKSGVTLPPKSEVFVGYLDPGIPSGLNGDILILANYSGAADNASTNLGVKFYKFVNGAKSSLIHKNEMSVKEDYTESGATSAIWKNAPAGAKVAVYAFNSWHRGTIINGKVNGNLLSTLM